MGCIGWCFFREASSPRRTGQSEIFNGLVLRGSSVSLIETARPRRGGRNRIFRVEPAKGARTTALSPSGRIHEGMDREQPTEKKAANNPPTRPRQPDQRSNSA
jgi:hypothetical protein